MIWLVNDDTILRGLLHLRDNDRPFLSMRFVEFCKLKERIIANNVGIENEEWRIVFAKDLFGQLQRSSRTEWLILYRELDVDVIFLLVLFSSQSLEALFLRVGFDLPSAMRRPSYLAGS